MTGKRRMQKPRAPVAEQHAPAIQRMREISNQSLDALYLCNAPVHPDHVLLGLCEEAMHALKQAAIVMAEYHAASDGPTPWRADSLTHGTASTMSRYGAEEALARAMRDSRAAKEAERAWQDARNTLFQRKEDWARQATNALRTAAKMKATTAAGIYAKALLVKSSAGSAAVLAMSMADDFLACEGLRASLWPATPVGDPPL